MQSLRWEEPRERSKTAWGVGLDEIHEDEAQSHAAVLRYPAMAVAAECLLHRIRSHSQNLRENTASLVARAEAQETVGGTTARESEY